MDQYQEYIHKSRYARWLPEEGRRETWTETVARLKEFWVDRIRGLGSADKSTQWEMEEYLSSVFDDVYNLDVMPSMRALMTAGPALDRDNVAGYNCAYLPIDHLRAFDEVLYILMCGTGVGFSVERKYISKLPEVPNAIDPCDTTIVVPDSKIGWAGSFRRLISHLYSGERPTWDCSRLRPAGTPLKTFGGRASGPAPLEALFSFTSEIFQKACGRRLSDLEVHDIICKVGEAVVVGGVRRSALISLSNPSSSRMRTAKSGNWFMSHRHRSLANNSACYTDKPNFEFFMKEMLSLYSSRAGERGFFSRTASDHITARSGRRETGHDWGTNPCSEIILRPNQFCNLSEVVIRHDDSYDTLSNKVISATILGTLQASLTDFRYLRKVWQNNCEEEALLGLSFTGIYDHSIMRSPKKAPAWLKGLKELAIETNKEWAERLGINPAAAITCVKPSGTVSQLANCASGIHARHGSYYIRRVRGDNKDPLSRFLAESGVPTEDDVATPGTVVHSFPIQSPKGAQTVDKVDALDQLKLWKVYQDHWCEHKPSITVHYTDDNFLQCAAWLWDNFDDVSGVAFLPLYENDYAQAPYESVSGAEYKEAAKAMPTLDWTAFDAMEEEDTTTGSQEFACVGNQCELP